MTRSLALVAVALVFAGCPNDTTKRVFPVIEFVDDMGQAKPSLDFKDVQVNTTATADVLVRNSGNTALTITKVDFGNPQFALKTMLPFTVGTGETLPLSVTFRPTEPDVLVKAAATITSDDPSKPTADVALQGRGVTAVAVGMPARIDFREVYRNERGTVNFVLTNAGGNDLTVTNAELLNVGPAVTGDLAALTKTIKGGEQATAAFTFAPTMQGGVDGGLKLTFGGEVGTLTVPVRGKGIESVPRLCFKFDDSPMEQCTTTGNDLLSVQFGDLCDNRLFPPDGGPSACRGADGGLTPGRRSGRTYFRNEGNTPVAYTVSYQTRSLGSCDAGSTIDFSLSNAPDSGAAMWSATRTSLPMTVTDPMPWESAPVSVTYVPRSNCADDSADQAQIIWTKQGEPNSRPPPSLFLTLSGASQLPRAQPQDMTLTGTTPLFGNFLGVGNAGSAPLTIRTVTLKQQSFLMDGGRSATPDEDCAIAGSTGDCGVFAWNGPAPVLPVTLPPSTGTITSRQLAGVVFGGDGGTAPVQNRTYRVWAVVETDDPYHGTVTSKIEATYR